MTRLEYHCSVKHDERNGNNNLITVDRVLPETKKPQGLEISFERTIRVPDNKELSHLPPSLGSFPLYKVQDYAHRLPQSMATAPFMIKIYCGYINVVSGEHAAERTETKQRRAKLLEQGELIQDYFVLPEQPWIDSVAIKPAVRRGYTVEAQITGEEVVGGLTFEITPGLCEEPPACPTDAEAALWVVDMGLIYAARNASSVHLHQGATLVFQSADQSNSAGENGTPGFSTYSFVYPRNSSKRGEPRALPSFVSLLFITEALGDGSGAQVAALDTPAGLSKDHFSSYAFYKDDFLGKIALINLKPFYKNSTEDFTVTVDLSQYTQDLKSPAQLKRMTAPHVDEGKTEKTTWAGQSFKNGEPTGELDIEEIGEDGLVEVRGSEAVLIFLDGSSVYAS
ncbi:hypothetical protein INS49_001074 [Diaporthe citri]|uniref:uncharacterized protein n=1 Tax=Diaporthe citri TaxID=83186 RepID=UPI001C7EF365|nr:uncharacterized protein INS49_001074 [Diaporthe citri]KAG6366893.1 hypothetical protein INS49_001074 [Diaporthe citri]